jgi:hypothetical protein
VVVPGLAATHLHYRHEIKSASSSGRDNQIASIGGLVPGLIHRAAPSRGNTIRWQIIATPPPTVSLTSTSSPAATADLRGYASVT